MTLLCPLKAALNKAVDPSCEDDKISVQIHCKGSSNCSGTKTFFRCAFNLHVFQRPDRPHARAAPSLSRCDPSAPPSTRGQ